MTNRNNMPKSGNRGGTDRSTRAGDVGGGRGRRGGSGGRGSLGIVIVFGFHWSVGNGDEKLAISVSARHQARRLVVDHHPRISLPERERETVSRFVSVIARDVTFRPLRVEKKKRFISIIYRERKKNSNVDILTSKISHRRTSPFPVSIDRSAW